MPSRCTFEMLDRPQSLSVEAIERMELETLFALGIVNPFGPTLNFVALAGKGATRDIIHAMLNPFLCTVVKIGTFSTGDEWNPVIDFEKLYQLDLGSCPTIILLHKGLTSADRRTIGQKLLQQFSDAPVTVGRVRQFFGDPWARLGASDTHDPPPNPEEDTDWIDMFLNTDHLGPELKAFLYAWDGSINKAPIPESMRESAFSFGRFELILKKILATVWLPPELLEKKHRPASVAPKSQPKTATDVRRLLKDSLYWSALTGDDLLEFLRSAMLVYGASSDGSMVPHLSDLCQHVVAHTDPEHRVLFLQSVASVAEENRLNPCTMLPLLVCDSNPTVVATACIDYVSLSKADESGLPRVFAELDTLFQKRTFENPGGVLGGLVELGDIRFNAQIIRWAKRLTEGDIEVAIQCRTGFVKHGAVMFWLQWAEELIRENNSDKRGLLGLAAAAISNMARRNTDGVVRDAERVLPAYSASNGVVEKRRWTKEDYAQFIADRLYSCEQEEQPPKVFSSVLRAWGLQPRAPISEQYVERSGSAPRPTK